MSYQKWIDQYARASYQLFSGNVLEAFQPLDFYHFFPLWYDLWLDKIYVAIQKIKKEETSLNKIVKYFPPPTSVRSFFKKIVSSFPHLSRQEVFKFKEIVSFLYNVLKHQCKKDIFAQNSNIIHTPAEINDILKNIKWQKSDKESAQNLGQLCMGIGHLINGLYNDVVTDVSWDVYGPYNISKKFKNKKTILLIRDFPNLKPIELWPETQAVKKIKYKEIKIYTIYKNLNCHIGYIGCHTTFSGGQVTGNMLKYAIIVDGKYKNDLGEIRKLKDYFLRLAVEQWPRLKNLSFEKLKQKVLLQECYQLQRFFEFLKIDWQPTEEMKERIKDKPLLSGIYPRSRIINFKEYCEYFGVNKLKSIFSS
ncbi:MAG: hypothetical protein AB1465_02370 [Patescibacteria group bacterium]